MNTHSFYVILLSLIVSATVSCSRNNPGTITSVDLGDAINMQIDSIMERVDVIPLEVNEENYPYGINNFYIADGNIIVVDAKNVIFVYSADGTYISDSSNKIGKGAGEYSIVTATSYNRHNKTVEVATPKQLLFYDLDFNLVRSSELPTRLPKTGTDGIMFGFIYDLSANEHLLIPESIFDGNRQMVLFDSDSGDVIKKIKYSDDIHSDITMQTKCLYDSPSGDILFFPPGISNYVFSYNKKTRKLSKQIHVDYGKDGITEKDLRGSGSDKERLKYFVMNTDKTIPLKTMLSGNNLIFVTKNGNTLKNFRTVIYNRETETAITVDSYQDGKPAFPLVDFADKDGLYCVVDIENLPAVLSSITKSKVRMPDTPVPEGCLVVVKYVLKDSF